MSPRPEVIANFALSVDGKVSTRCHAPSAYTSDADKARLREIRSLGDALLAGAATVAADNMSMRLTDPPLQEARVGRGQTPEPLRVIVSNSGKVDPALKVFRHAPVVLFSTTTMPEHTRSALTKQCDLWLFDHPQLPLPSVMAVLRKEYRVRKIVCEGGPTLFRSLAEAELIDRLFLTLHPRIFGGRSAPTLSALAPAFLKSPLAFRLTSCKTVGSECFLEFHRTRKKI